MPKSAPTEHWTSVQDTYNEHLAAGEVDKAEALRQYALDHSVTLRADDDLRPEETDNFINQAIEQSYE